MYQTKEIIGKVDSLRSIIVKQDGKFDLRTNYSVKTTSENIGELLDYDSRLETMYTTMSLRQPGWLHLSEYLLPNWYKVRPQNWAKETILEDGEHWAVGLLFPKRDEEKQYNFISANYTMETVDGEIEQFITDTISYNSGIKLISDTCSNGLSNTKSTFLTTTLIFGESMPSNTITLFGIYTSDRTTYLELGVNSSGFMIANVIYNGSSDIQWVSTNNTYKFNPNTTYEIQFGYINNAYLLRINSSDNVKFIGNYNVSGDIHFEIGSFECVDGDISFTVNNLTFNDGGSVTWTPMFENMKHNYETFGNPILSDGVISGFSTSNYIKTDVNALDFSIKPWVLNTKFTTGNNVNTQQIIFEGESGYYDSLRIQIYQGYMYNGYNVSGSWVFMQNASPALQPNTTYWYRVEVLDGIINFYTSLDGIDYELSLTKNISSYPTEKKYIIGNGETSPFLGTLDLNETKITRNGEILWQPFTQPYSEYKDSYKIYNIEPMISLETKSSIYGSPKIENGVVSDFSANNYLTLPSDISQIPMEIYISFSTGTDISSMQNILHKGGFLEVFVIGSRLKMWSSNTGEVEIATVTTETKYWLKINIELSSQTYFVGNSGHNNYTIEKVVNDGGITLGTTVMKFGGHNDNTGNYWRGSIDFNDTYMIVNNDIHWTPFDDVEVSYDVYGLCTKDFVYTGSPMTMNAYRIIYNDDSEETLLGVNEPNDDDIKNVTLVKSDIIIGEENDWIWRYNSDLERFVSVNGVQLKLNIYPSTATVSVISENDIQDNGNNTYLMKTGSEVTISVSNEYYDSYNSTITVNEDMIYDITLNPTVGTIDINDYNYTMNDDTLILTDYNGDDGNIVIPKIEE